jgi:hypothetical protein
MMYNVRDGICVRIKLSTFPGREDDVTPSFDFSEQMRRHHQSDLSKAQASVKTVLDR